MVGQDHHHASTFLSHLLQRRPQRPVGGAGVLGTHQVAQRVNHMHPHQGRLFAANVAHDHGHVHATFDAVFIRDQAEGAMHGR